MIDIEIDKLTNLVEEVATGLSHDTFVSRADKREIRALSGKWRFDWLKELVNHEVYKLTIPRIGTEIQGLVSIQRLPGFIQVSLIENHPKMSVARKRLPEWPPT